MKKRAILIDGNNLLYRSYYATAYTGNIMKNSKGFPTNALYGFINMLNKILNEEKPEYIMVAFDKGKNFRHDLYKEYKDGRNETPQELKDQFPLAKEICTLLGIKYIECDNYEADDIIGTFAKMADNDKLYNATIISSDKDLLQLISDEVTIKLLKQKDYIFMDENTFFEIYGIEPIKMIDLKALMGDPSDNIPGVKGIGEKTALTLLQKYGSLNNIYNNIDNIKGKIKEKLIQGKESAYFSYNIATIFKDIDLGLSFEDIKYQGVDRKNLIEKYKELEFNSFLKNIPDFSNNDDEEKKDYFDFIRIKSVIDIDFSNSSFYLEVDNNNYHIANIVGASIYDGKYSYYFDLPAILMNRNLFKKFKVTFDLKKNLISLSKYNITTDSSFDMLIGASLLNYNIKDDLAYLSTTFGEDIPYYDNLYVKKKNNNSENIKEIAIVKKAKFLYDFYDEVFNKLNEEEICDLYSNIEHPLIYVLADMEKEGIRFDVNALTDLKGEIEIKLNNLSNTIFNYAGEKFNISSPKQLGDILYNKLRLPRYKKESTAHEVITKLKNAHPIINEILEYRELFKLYNTYLNNYDKFVQNDNKIHTIYKQTGARTGRLSSIEPNLQNIPIRGKEGRKMKKAFLPEADSYLLSSDYSQIELRLLAHISGCENLINAFNNNDDIHSKVASDIFSIPIENVTSNQRRAAKAVIFGIVYGISGYGLGENLEIDFVEAKEYIKKYLNMYPGVNEYMINIKNFAREHGFVRTIMNRKREIEEIKSNNKVIQNAGERIALNTPIQGSSADIIKLAMVKMHEEFKKRNLKSKMILQVHDELIFTVLKSEINEIQSIIKDIMENVYELSVPLKVDINYGNNWYEAK